MALSASWIATWVMAYIRASWSGSSPGEMHAASAASPAFAFHSMTALEPPLGLPDAACPPAVLDQVTAKIADSVKRLMARVRMGPPSMTFRRVTAAP